jgi:hypothetical protein
MTVPQLISVISLLTRLAYFAESAFVLLPLIAETDARLPFRLSWSLVRAVTILRVETQSRADS